MSLIIKNKTRRLLTVTLNSGETVHLAPGEVSQPLNEIETANNAKIQRLSNDGMVETAVVSDHAHAHGGEAVHAPTQDGKALTPHRRNPK